MAVVVDPLTGTDLEAPEILEECRQKMLSEGWDLAICLTDLPVYRDGRLVAADVSGQRGVSGLSLPALGATRLRPRARDLTLRLAHELYASVQAGGFPVLYDDRGGSAGVKFNDADLIGIPLRLTVSKRSVGDGVVEAKWRSDSDRLKLDEEGLAGELGRLG